MPTHQTEDRFLSRFPAARRHIVTGQFHFRTLKTKTKPEKVVDHVLSDWNRRIFSPLSLQQAELYAGFRKIVSDNRHEAEQYAEMLLARKRGQ